MPSTFAAVAVAFALVAALAVVSARAARDRRSTRSSHCGSNSAMGAHCRIQVTARSPSRIGAAAPAACTDASSTLAIRWPSPIRAGSAARVSTERHRWRQGYVGGTFSSDEHFGTHLDAPAHFGGAWTVDSIPGRSAGAAGHLHHRHGKTRGLPDHARRREGVRGEERRDPRGMRSCCSPRAGMCAGPTRRNT